ncbi:MAG: SMC-Scp complex subunit ScpB [Clostridia bacterium]|nr:SMC-Scp complex subunit ScpB [Clostridia bacterium]
MNKEEMFRVIEGILFVSNEPVPVKGIAAAIETSFDDAAIIMEELIEKYNEDETRGIKIIKADGKYQLVTKQNIFKYLQKANTELEKPRITPAMLETLAIVAYKQPITRLEIESIRGVNSDHVVSKLVEYDLVCEVGRAEKIGHPILFGTTDKFLMYFGMSALNDLPEVEASKEITNDNIDEELLKLKEGTGNERIAGLEVDEEKIKELKAKALEEEANAEDTERDTEEIEDVTAETIDAISNEIEEADGELISSDDNNSEEFDSDDEDLLSLDSNYEDDDDDDEDESDDEDEE